MGENVPHMVNICFHGIGVPARPLEPGEDQYWIPVDVFDEIIDYAQSKPTAMALSFDDGNASDVDVALPRLISAGVTGSFFPVADRIGKPGSVDRTGLRDLAAHGMTIGSHGMRHRQWRGLDDSDLDEELIGARRLIQEQAGASIDTAACPLGSYDRRVLKRLRHLGYATVYTSDRCTGGAKWWLQPRYSIRLGDTLDDVRAIVERPEPLPSRAKSVARMTAKRLR